MRASVTLYVVKLSLLVAVIATPFGCRDHSLIRHYSELLAQITELLLQRLNLFPIFVVLNLEAFDLLGLLFRIVRYGVGDLHVLWVGPTTGCAPMWRMSPVNSDRRKTGVRGGANNRVVTKLIPRQVGVPE